MFIICLSLLVQYNMPFVCRERLLIRGSLRGPIVCLFHIRECFMLLEQNVRLVSIMCLVRLDLSFMFDLLCYLALILISLPHCPRHISTQD